MNKNILERLERFKGVSKLKKAAMNNLVKMSDQKIIDQLRAEFQKMDRNNTGRIEAADLRRAIVRSRMTATEHPGLARTWKSCCLASEDYEEKVEQIIREIDYYDNNEINYTEFLVATLDV